jgi:hypothetical protein
LKVLLPAVALAFTACAGASVSGDTARRWLVVAATRTTVVAAIDAARELSRRWPDAHLVASSDCEALKPGLFLVAVAVDSDRTRADAALQRVKAAIPDAYVRECRPTVASTMAAGVPLIDPSIQRVPADAVNWSDADRTSAVVPLDHGFVWLKRWYAADPNDPLEGRRESVLIVTDRPDRAKELKSRCTDAAAVPNGRWIAITCVTGTAADNVLHETTVFDLVTGQELKTVPRCSDPAFDSDTSIRCGMEAVGPDGTLRVTPRTVPFR